MAETPEAFDPSLLRAARQGDTAAARDLLVRYLPRLRAFVRLRMPVDVRARESSLDAVQSVCGELLGELHRFEFRGETEFRGWLFTGALNKLRNKRRGLHQRKRDVAREAAATADNDIDAVIAESGLLPSPSQAAIGNEAAERLERAFDQLPEHYQEVIALARIARLPHAEIALRIGKSETATRQLLGRALIDLASRIATRG